MLLRGIIRQVIEAGRFPKRKLSPRPKYLSVSREHIYEQRWFSSSSHPLIMGWEHGACAEALSFGKQHWAAAGEGGAEEVSLEGFPHTFFSPLLRGKHQVGYQENTFQAVSFFEPCRNPGSPNREHLTITMGEQADLPWKNRINFVLHIQSVFLDKCHQGHSLAFKNEEFGVCAAAGMSSPGCPPRQCDYLHLHSDCSLFHNDFVHSGVLNLICIDLNRSHSCILNSER